MSLPKSLVQPLRQGQLTVGAGWRAYFAPFNQEYAVSQTSSALGPKIYDLSFLNKFVDTPSALPAGWSDLGYVKNFKFTPGDKTGSVMTGYRGAIRAKYRAEIGEKMSFTFGEMTRLALSIATGTQVFNVLKTSATGIGAGPLTAPGQTAVAMGGGGYTAVGSASGFVGQPTLAVATGSGASFTVGSMIVCDQDYDNTSFGYIGDAGANVFQGAVTDTDFIRKTSDYVAGIAGIVGDVLVLTNKFNGGGNALGANPTSAPTAGAKVQTILGYASRSGGTFIREWSAIFLLDTIDASQILRYYPRVSPDTFGGLTATNLQNATALQTYDMDCSFDALAFDDPLDGETVSSYMAYFPHPGTVPTF
jgi:hypothetical protein